MAAAGTPGGCGDCGPGPSPFGVSAQLRGVVSGVATGVGWPRLLPVPLFPSVMRLLLFRGMSISGATFLVSLTDGTRAVRPLAPRHPGRSDENACDAGSVSLTTRSRLLPLFPPGPDFAPLSAFGLASLRTRSPNIVIGFRGEVASDGGEPGDLLNPCAYSAGFT